MIVAGLINLSLFWSNPSKFWFKDGRMRMRGRAVFSQRQWYWFWNHYMYCVVFLLNESTEKLGMYIYTSQSGNYLSCYCILSAYYIFYFLFLFILLIAFIRSNTHLAKHSLFWILLFLTAIFNLSLKAKTCLSIFYWAVVRVGSPNCSQIAVLFMRLPYQVVKCSALNFKCCILCSFRHLIRFFRLSWIVPQIVRFLTLNNLYYWSSTNL